MWTRNCQECGKEFTTNNHSQIYCNSECRKEGMKQYRRDFMRNYWKINPTQNNKNHRQAAKRNKENKTTIFTHYSGNPPKCACCGETEIRFLELDHINGGGNKERKNLFKYYIGGKMFYRWLIQNNFPEGYQVLCCNCNNVKRDSKIRFCKVHHPELYEGNKNE